MEQNLNLLEKLHAAHQRAFVLHDDSWLSPSAWVVGGLIVIAAVAAEHFATHWHERRLARMRPAFTRQQSAQARAWFGAGNWAVYVLVVVGYVLACNWP